MLENELMNSFEYYVVFIKSKETRSRILFLLKSSRQKSYREDDIELKQVKSLELNIYATVECSECSRTTAQFITLHK